MPDLKLTTLDHGARLLGQVVKKADVDGDGFITRKDLDAAGPQLGKTATEALARITESATFRRDRTVAGFKKALGEVKTRLRAVDKDGDGTLTPAEQKRVTLKGASALVTFSNQYRNADASDFGVSKPIGGATASDFGHVDTKGTAAEVLGRIVKRWNRKRNDNYWPGHDPSRFVLGAQEAKDVAKEIATLPPTKAKSVLRELSRNIKAGGYKCVYVDPPATKPLDDLAKQLHLKLSFVGPTKAPPFPGY